ncbi:MAG: mechanosensitive ion channel family protein [Acidobacteria bacterium]|nr:mechanosensitive ion channel family protein [Acidobacteriota bacterium]
MKQFADFLRFWGEWHGTGRFLAVLAVAIFVLGVLRLLLLRGMKKAAQQTETVVDDDIVFSLRGPARLWVILGGLIVAVRTLDERDIPKSVSVILADIMAILFLISVTMVASRVTIIFLRHKMATSGGSQRITTLTTTMIRILWAIPGFLVVLRLFEVSLAPALTALGVGGLAVSLALKDTLANVFSGFYISMAGNIHKGDYIKLDSGQEGFVEDVKWRITSLRTLQNNLVVIPNSKLSEALVTNYSYPDKRMALPIQIGVEYGSDLLKVEAALLSVAQASAGQVEGLLADPPPVVRFNPGFGDSSLNLTLVVQIAEFPQQFAVMDELRRRILLRFREEGIGIPFPVRTLDLAPGSLKRALEDTPPSSSGR